MQLLRIVLLFGMLGGCGNGSGDDGESATRRDGGVAMAAADDSSESGGAHLPPTRAPAVKPDANGQTGSMGAMGSDECQQDSECAEQAQNYFDAQRELGAMVLVAKCSSGVCRSVIELDGQCYADRAPWSTAYDCALGSMAILEQALAAEGAAATPPLLPVSVTPYVDGSDGFVEFGVTQGFEGTAMVASGFGVDAQFFAPIDGSEMISGEVLDPLEGTDDCGVMRKGNVGTSPFVEFRRVTRATLLDDGEEIPLVEFMSGGLFSYGAQLDRAPRFGGRYGVHVEGGEFGAAFDSDDVTLPQALSFTTFEQAARFERADLVLRWTGSGKAPLRIRLFVTPRLSDVGGDLEVQCLVKDDGEFTIPAAVLQAVPESIVSAYVVRENRNLQSDGGHNVLIDARIANNYHFALGAACDGSDVMAACARYAQALQQTYADCNVPPQPMAELCPDYLAESCVACPEYFDCKASATRCENGGLFTEATCSCD